MDKLPYCGGSGFIAIPASSPGPPEGECCPGCPQCDPHDVECERELTSHGYTPCRCRERFSRIEVLRQRDELLAFVRQVAELSILLVDHDKEITLIQRARALVGQPEF